VTKIIVDEGQARIIAQATDVVEVRDQEGRILGYVTHGFTAEDVAVAQERLLSGQPRFSTQEVLRRLKSADQS